MLKPADQITHPDPRVARTSGRDGLSPLTMEQQHDWVAVISLSPRAPEAVAEAFDRARNAFVYAWFSYDLSALAEAQALFTVELALRQRLGPRAAPGDTVSNLIEKAIKDKLLQDSPPPGQPGLALMVRTMRNEWAHGSVHIHTPAMTVSLVQFCADIVNQLFDPI